MDTDPAKKSSESNAVPVQIPQIIRPDEDVEPTATENEKAAFEKDLELDQGQPRQSTHLSIRSRPYNYRKESFEVASGRPSLDTEDGDRTFSTLDNTTTISEERPSASRGTTVASQKSAGSRSLPPLRRMETKLAQKDAHPW